MNETASGGAPEVVDGVPTAAIAVGAVTETVPVRVHVAPARVVVIVQS